MRKRNQAHSRTLVQFSKENAISLEKRYSLPPNVAVVAAAAAAAAAAAVAAAAATAAAAVAAAAAPARSPSILPPPLPRLLLRLLFLLLTLLLRLQPWLWLTPLLLLPQLQYGGHSRRPQYYATSCTVDG